MAEVRNISFNKDQYGIGSSAEYIQKVRGLFNSSINSRNDALMYNPNGYRYYYYPEALTSVDSPLVGEEAKIGSPRIGRSYNYLDDVGGLLGYTYLGGYLKTNNFKTIMNYDGVKYNQKDFDYNIENLYINGQNYGTTGADSGTLSRLNRLGFYYQDYENQGTSIVQDALNQARVEIKKNNQNYYPSDNPKYNERMDYVKFSDSYYTDRPQGLSGQKDFDYLKNTENVTKDLLSETEIGKLVPFDSTDNNDNTIKYKLYSTSDENIRRNKVFLKENINQYYSTPLGNIEKLDRLQDYNFNEIPELVEQIRATQAIAAEKSFVNTSDIEPYLGKNYKFDERYTQDALGKNTTHDEFGDNISSVDSELDILKENYGTTTSAYTENRTTYYLYNERTEGNSNTFTSDVKENHDNTVVISKISTKAKKGLLKKTNDLFNDGKIGSMINRFDQKGLSRGRALKSVKSENINGYDNPYCRVWTSHYQYSKMRDRIRPFYDENGNPIDTDFLDNSLGKGLRPFMGKSLRGLSSMDTNGFPIITPKNNGGELDKDSIKRCMFSIENLAWKDMKFDAPLGQGRSGSVLSKEQQGPNGGRIMWFPPYNLKFEEQVGVNWNGNSFIGRGEQIFTYVNTERTGSLSFTLLVDHPSIIDEYVKSIGDDSATLDNEEEILRFFAGCGLGVTKSTTQTQVAVEKEIEKISNDAEPEDDGIIDRYFVFFPNNFSGIDYIKNQDTLTAINYLKNGSIYGVNGYEMTVNKPIKGCIKSEIITGQTKGDNPKKVEWHYEVDSDTVCQSLSSSNYKDEKSFGLNSSDYWINTAFTNEGKVVREMLSIQPTDRGHVFSFEDFLSQAFFVAPHEINENNTGGNPIEYDVEIQCIGYASSHGAKVSCGGGNYNLAKNRARFIAEYIMSRNIIDNNKVHWDREGTLNAPGNDVSSLEAKVGRSVEIRVIYRAKTNTQPSLDRTEENKMPQTMIEYQTVTTTTSAATGSIYTKTASTESINGAYDEEYLYFKRINDENDLIRRNIVDKVRYFDPAFHSITPEGFNSRLTFLHQCTRQGPTVAVSDVKTNFFGAGNLAFGRPPVCVLRIGDFYNTKIIIDSVTINYDNDGIQWDMNPEGIGLQPMMANVTIQFKFLGGSDLSGPISRLQNAVSYNFFANAAIYDRHADYRESWITPEEKDLVNEWRASINVSDNGNNEVKIDKK